MAIVRFPQSPTRQALAPAYSTRRPHPDVPARLRAIADGLQVLCLTNPRTARWLMDWIELVLRRYVPMIVVLVNI